MRAIVEENEFSRRTTDTLSDDLAALSYRIIGVSGGIYAAQSIAFEVPERGSRIIEGWNKVKIACRGWPVRRSRHGRRGRSPACPPSPGRTAGHTAGIPSPMR